MGSRAIRFQKRVRPRGETCGKGRAWGSLGRHRRVRDLRAHWQLRSDLFTVHACRARSRLDIDGDFRVTPMPSNCIDRPQSPRVHHSSHSRRGARIAVPRVGSRHDCTLTSTLTHHTSCITHHASRVTRHAAPVTRRRHPRARSPSRGRRSAGRRGEPRTHTARLDARARSAPGSAPGARSRAAPREAREDPAVTARAHRVAATWEMMVYIPRVHHE
jgi:hypothetical protein